MTKSFSRTIFESCHRSIYGVVAPRYGSACAISGKHFATAAHVVKGVNRAKLRRTVGGPQEVIANIVAVDESSDIAILRCPEIDVNLTSVPIAEEPALYGDSAVVIGYPITFHDPAKFEAGLPMQNLRLNACIVASDLDLPFLDGSSGTFNVFEVDANLHPGMSGAPVFNAEGCLTGIISHGFVRSRENQNIIAVNGTAVTPQYVFDESHYTVAIRASDVRNLLHSVAGGQ